MKDEWLTFYSRFLATELFPNSAARKTSLFKSAYLSHTKSDFDDLSTIGKISTRSIQLEIYH